MIIQKVAEATANPKAGMTGAVVGIGSWMANVWQWLGTNASTILLLVSIIVGLVSIWNQIDQIRHRNK